MLICALSAVYGGKYMSHTTHPEKTGWSWFLYNLLTASMFVVVTAQNAVLFLLAWEIMSLASFFLVIFDSGKPAVRYAGLTYLVATHIATFFLVVMFIGSTGTGSDRIRH
jgi:hydrogenase-4 component B